MTDVLPCLLVDANTECTSVGNLPSLVYVVAFTYMFLLAALRLQPKYKFASAVTALFTSACTSVARSVKEHDLSSNASSVTAITSSRLDADLRCEAGTFFSSLTQLSVNRRDVHCFTWGLIIRRRLIECPLNLRWE